MNINDRPNYFPQQDCVPRNLFTSRLYQEWALIQNHIMDYEMNKELDRSWTDQYIGTTSDTTQLIHYPI